MNSRLNAKDFILIGALTALMWIICMVISTVMSLLGPVTNVFYPPVVAIPNGIVMMLLLAKVPKKGALAISGIIQGLLFLVVGAFWFIPIALVIGGVICDLFVIKSDNITAKAMMIAFALFSAIFTFGAIAPMKFLQKAYMEATAANGISQDYIDGLICMTSVPMLIVIVVVGFICGILGGMLGQKVLKKHFVKAGLVSI